MGARSRCTQVDIRDMGLHYAWHSELEAQETDVVRSPGYDEVNSQHATSRLAESRKCDLTRPHNFMMMPKIAPFGYPAGVNPANPNFTLITRLASERKDWINSKCIKIHNCDSPTYRLKFDYTDDGISVSPVNFYQL